VFYKEQSCLLENFKALVSQTTRPADVAHASKIAKNVPIYDCAALRSKLSDDAQRQEIMTELGLVLQSGAGVFVLKQAFADRDPIDRASVVFSQIIHEERDQASGGDHFAKTGANDRAWNALEKLCLKAPDVFARYYANDMVTLAAEAWLGPGYQITSQVNVVHPGGEAQQAHCDYHLGFQTVRQAGRYPAHAHHMSSRLTLQGAVAHCDMPVQSGPTKILPFSQTYPNAYMAWRRDDFAAYFEEHHIQLALKKGDMVFFNPSLFHAAGANTTTDIARMANLLQISSAFGRAMESIDRQKMSLALYPGLLAAYQKGEMTFAEISNTVTACAEGYSFPTNLDRDPPLDGMAPKTQQDMMLEALKEGHTAEQFSQTMVQLKHRQAPN